MPITQSYWILLPTLPDSPVVSRRWVAPTEEAMRVRMTRSSSDNPDSEEFSDEGPRHPADGASPEDLRRPYTQGEDSRRHRPLLSIGRALRG